MAWAALLTLAWLLEPATSPETTASHAAEAPSSNQAPSSNEAPSSNDAPPGIESRARDDAEAEPGRSIIIPWAAVPLQSAMPTSPAPALAPLPRTRTSAPLLDPWSETRRVRVPPLPDPELRDPFRGMWASRGVQAPDERRTPPGPHVAHVELRDPFAGGAARRPSTSGTSPPRASTAPPHPELRDPFGQPTKTRATPPPALPQGEAPIPPSVGPSLGPALGPPLAPRIAPAT